MSPSASLPIDARGRNAFNTSVAFDSVAAVFVIGRCFARFWMVRTCGADDVLILFAFTAAVTFTALVEAQNQHGLGRHFESLSPANQVEVMKPFWASVVIYYLGLTLIKCSILCQFQRFFVGQTIRRACWALLALVALYGICTIIGAIFSCTPVPFFWDKTIHKGHCMNLLAFWFSNATFNIVSDIAIVILPMPVLKSLHLPKKQKYSLILVFAVGGFGCITSIIRLQSLYTVAHSTDYTWNNVGAATWSSIELAVGITCACLPTLKPLVNYFFPKLLLSRRPATGQARPNTQHSIVRDTRLMQHTIPRDAEAQLEAGVPHGFPVPKLNWKDDDKVYLRTEHEEYASSSEGGDARKSSIVLNNYAVIQ